MEQEIFHRKELYIIYILIFLFVIKYYITTLNIDSYWSNFFKIVLVFYFYFSMTFGLIIKRYYITKEIIFIIVLSLLYLIFKTPFSKNIFVIYIVSILILKIGLQNYYNFICKLLSVILIFHFIIYFLGLISDNPIIGNGVLGRIAIRYSIGFRSVNALPLMIFFLYSYNILRTKMISKLNFFLILVSVIIVYFTQNKTLIFLIVFMNIIYIVLRLIKFTNYIINFILQLSYFFAGIFTIYISLVYKYSGLLTKLNDFLSYRLRYWANIVGEMRFIDYFKGHDIYSISKVMNSPIDNSYIYAVFGMGIFFFILYSIFYYKLIKQLILDRKYKEIAVLTTFVLYSLVENIYYYAIFNPTFLIMVQYLFYKGKKLNGRDFCNHTHV